MIEDSNVPLDKIVTAILGNAFDSGVREVHIERHRLDAPVQDEIRGLATPLSFARDEGVFVLFRVADNLEKQSDLPQFVLEPLTARIRELSGANASKGGIAEGRLQFERGLRHIEWRVWIGPSETGEKVVLRQMRD